MLALKCQKIQLELQHARAEVSEDSVRATTCSGYPDPPHISVRSEDSLKLALLENDLDWATAYTFPNT